MIIQYCSDLHLEEEANSSYLTKKPLQVKGDILILAGDIAPLHDIYLKHPFFEFISENFKHVFWVPGNHEFYHKDIGKYSSSYHIKLNSKISVVNNVEIQWGNIHFVFSTLWANISKEKEKLAEQNIPDFTSITKNNKRFTTADFNMLHLESIAFLKEAFRIRQENTVVVTHHAPSKSSVSPKYKYSSLNEAFSSALDELIAESGAGFWIYGHTHFNYNPYLIGKTFMLTNQLGYKHYNECDDFKTDAHFCI